MSEEDGWRPRKAKGSEKKPKREKEVVRLEKFLAAAEKPEFRLNLATQRVERFGVESQNTLEAYYIDVAHLGFDVSKKKAFDVLTRAAIANAYDPICEYLGYVAKNVAPADISTISSTYLRPGDNPGNIFDELLMRTLIAAVKRRFEPGCKHDTACVLMGPQGVRKSTFWEVLGGEYFSDRLKGISSRDDIMKLHRCWIMEMGELERLTTQNQAARVKDFLSQQTDELRAPYARESQGLPRRSIIVGSTSETTGFLVDNLYTLHFWVIPTTCGRKKRIDIEELALNRDAIWSGAMKAYRAGEKTFLSDNREDELKAQNSKYVAKTPT